MSSKEKSQRLRERVKLQLPVRVMCRETAGFEWVEMTRLLDVTPFGAAFRLARPTEPGRLLQLTMPMPRQLRCFDFTEEQYRVWALVRRLQPREGDDAGGSETGSTRFEIGVAFVGKHPPVSYLKDPSTRYEPTGSPMQNDIWEVQEKSAPDGGPHARPRSIDTRLQMPVEVSVEVFDEKGGVEVREQTVTENLSRRGASVWTTLQVERGRFVRLTSERYQLSVIAAVRASRAGADGILRLHLEFIDRQWPLEGVE